MTERVPSLDEARFFVDEDLSGFPGGTCGRHWCNALPGRQRTRVHLCENGGRPRPLTRSAVEQRGPLVQELRAGGDEFVVAFAGARIEQGETAAVLEC